MAIAGSILETSGSATNQTSYSTGTLNPSGSGLAVYACVVSDAATGTPDTPSIGGLGATWTQEKTQLSSNSAVRATLFRASGSMSSGAITFDFGAQTQATCEWSVLQFTGVDTATADGIVQSVSGSGGSNKTPTVTLAAFGDAANATVFFAGADRSTSWTVEGGYTTGGSSSHEDCTLGAEWLLANDTTPSGTWGDNSRWAAIGIEVKVSTAVAPTPKSGSDTIAVGVSETGRAAVLIAHADTIAVAVSDVSRGVVIGILAADTIRPLLVEYGIFAQAPDRQARWYPVWLVDLTVSS